MIAPTLIESALRAWRPALVVRPSDAVYHLVIGAPRSLAAALPDAVKPFVLVGLDLLEKQAGRTSTTTATPLDPIVTLSPDAVADPITEACTLAHEWCHVNQIARNGRVQATADYTDGELRAQREADAAAAGLCLRYWLTGELPNEAPALSDLYLLGAGAAATARGILASHLASIRDGACPPIDVCVRLAQWLHATPHAPDEVRARVPRVPT